MIKILSQYPDFKAASQACQEYNMVLDSFKRSLIRNIGEYYGVSSSHFFNCRIKFFLRYLTDRGLHCKNVIMAKTCYEADLSRKDFIEKYNLTGLISVCQLESAQNHLSTMTRLMNFCKKNNLNIPYDINRNYSAIELNEKDMHDFLKQYNYPSSHYRHEDNIKDEELMNASLIELKNVDKFPKPTKDKGIILKKPTKDLFHEVPKKVTKITETQSDVNPIITNTLDIVSPSGLKVCITKGLDEDKILKAIKFMWEL